MYGIDNYIYTMYTIKNTKRRRIYPTWIIWLLESISFEDFEVLLLDF